MNNKNILVIGDSILDETNICSAIGLSLESPTLKTSLQSSKVTFGGAANVVNNLLQLGATVNYITAIGNDKYEYLYREWSHENLNLFRIPVDRNNTVKSRFWVQKSVMYKYLQVNSGTKKPYDSQTIDKVLKIVDHLEHIDCVLLVDYGLGMFSDVNNANKLLKCLRNKNATIIFSSQISDGDNNYPRFKGVDYMCMNVKEAKANLECFEPTQDKIHRLSTLLGSNVCVTLGPEGSIYKRGNQIIRDKAHPVESLDPTGAGDAFLASFALEYNGNSLSDCNKWAALSTLNYGTGLTDI